MTFLLVLSRHWQGFGLRLRRPYGCYASWLVLGWVAFAFIPDGLDFTYPMMTRRYVREWGDGCARGVSLFVSFDNPRRFFAPAWGWHTGGVWRALSLPFVSFGAQFVGWPLAVHANYC